MGFWHNYSVLSSTGAALDHIHVDDAGVSRNMISAGAVMDHIYADEDAWLSLNMIYRHKI